MTLLVLAISFTGICLLADGIDPSLQQGASHTISALIGMGFMKLVSFIDDRDKRRHDAQIQELDRKHDARIQELENKLDRCNEQHVECKEQHDEMKKKYESLEKTVTRIKRRADKHHPEDSEEDSDNGTGLKKPLP